MFPSAETALTHILVVRDPARSRARYTDVLGATLYREDGASVVLSERRTRVGFDREAYEQAVIEHMRQHGGVISSGPMAGSRLLVLNTIGATSGWVSAFSPKTGERLVRLVSR